MYYDRKPGENCQGLQRPVLEKNNPTSRVGEADTHITPGRRTRPRRPFGKSSHAARSGAKSRRRIAIVSRVNEKHRRCPRGRGVFRSAGNIPYTRERPGGALARRPVSECKKSPEWRQPFRGACQRISTCRPCHRRQREPQARERECPPPGIRWSAPSQPRRRRSAAQNGSPWWDR